MKRSLSFVPLLLAFAVGAAYLVYGVMGYLLIGIRDGVEVDGLGRQLLDPPWWLLMFNQTEWRGYTWFFIDITITLVAVGVIYVFYKLYVVIRKED